MQNVRAEMGKQTSNSPHWNLSTRNENHCLLVMKPKNEEFWGPKGPQCIGPWGPLERWGPFGVLVRGRAVSARTPLRGSTAYRSMRGGGAPHHNNDNNNHNNKDNNNKKKHRQQQQQQQQQHQQQQQQQQQQQRQQQQQQKPEKKPN